MSSPNHPTFDIEHAFSSNSPDYILASLDYFPTSPGNTYSDSSVNSSELIPIASLTPLLSHNDPYIKVMHAYYVRESPIPTLITSSTVLSPSPVLPLTLFNPQDFFVPEELLPSKKQIFFLYSSTTDSSDLPRNQAYNLVIPSFSVHTPTPPQIFETRKSSIKMHLRYHEKQIEDILNYLEELSFYRLEKIRSHISDLQKKHLGQKEKIAFARFRISNLEQALKDIQAPPAMNQAAIRQLIDDRVAAALEAEAANMENNGNTNRNPEQAPQLYRGCKVKFATGTSTEEALSWWNSFAQPIGIEEAYKITWVEFKKLLIKKYCPRTEIWKMEDEFYHLTVKGNDLKTYVRRF
nr:reverse transcriptase domain-containing protein [Tanacetum cinerariifolium]